MIFDLIRDDLNLETIRFSPVNSGVIGTVGWPLSFTILVNAFSTICVVAGELELSVFS